MKHREAPPPAPLIDDPLADDLRTMLTFAPDLPTRDPSVDAALAAIRLRVDNPRLSTEDPALVDAIADLVPPQLYDNGERALERGRKIALEALRLLRSRGWRPA